MTKLLVTGGAAFIGSHFIRYWLSNHPSDSIINLDLLTYAGNLANLDDVVMQYADRYLFIKGDIADFDLMFDLLSAHRPDVIVNFAAETHNSRAVENPGVFFRTNVLGTQRLLEAARRAGIPRFHHISTCEVYGDMDLDSRTAFSETSPLKPRTPYNASKAGADLAVRAYFETYGMRVTISNCCNNYGPNQLPEKVIPHFATLGMMGRKLTLYRNSQYRREWMHVVDHCRAVERILLEGNIGETYNVGSGTETDVETIAAVVIDVLKLNDSYKTYVPDRPGHDRRYLLDSTKIHSQLGWTPTIPLDQGLRETIEWYRDNRNWWEPLLERAHVDEAAWGDRTHHA